VGTFIAGSNLVSFYVFREMLGLRDALAVSGMYAIATGLHFFGHRRVTFRAHQDAVQPQGMRYVLMLGINFLIYQAVVGSAPLLGVSPYIAVVFAGALTIASNFFVMKYFVFAGDRKTG
jgi:putative flippase GtrA